MKLKLALGFAVFCLCAGCGFVDGNQSPAAPMVEQKPAPAKTKFRPAPGTNKIDPKKVESHVPEYRAKTSSEFSAAMNETDYNKRAAAGRVFLERSNIPVSEAGVDAIEKGYLAGGDRRRMEYGFFLLGVLAQQDIALDRIQAMILDYVEKNPKDAMCDGALWSLGEAGSGKALDHFFRIASDTEKYGPAARERSFCCVAQCGRYSATTRFENIPRILELGRKLSDPQSRTWCLMALRDMAPGVNLSTLAEWEAWYADQQK